VLAVTASQFAFRNFIPSPFPPPGEEPRNREPGLQTSASGMHPPKGFLSLRAALDILVYWSLVGVCQGITNFRRSQQRERRAAKLEARLTRSKLQALRMQINPHFLFNTLNAISTLIYVNPRAADEMLGDLSELLRRSLDSMEEQEIPLARELEFIHAYIGIEQKRFGDRLRMEKSVPDELMIALVPALILQPLVENAIRHGIEPQRAPGLITIEAKRDGKNLHLVVQDNGKGLPAGDANRLEGRGIGLANTQARLRELYGEYQQFSFSRGEPRGCTVEVRLPFHTEPVQLSTTSAEERL
jgi:LytS/YehU family sensor histidine kinase